MGFSFPRITLKIPISDSIPNTPTKTINIVVSTNRLVALDTDHRSLLTITIMTKKIVSTVASTKPWFAWYLINLDSVEYIIGITANQNRYERHALNFLPFKSYCSVCFSSISSI